MILSWFHYNFGKFNRLLQTYSVQNAQMYNFPKLLEILLRSAVFQGDSTTIFKEKLLSDYESV